MTRRRPVLPLDLVLVDRRPQVDRHSRFFPFEDGFLSRGPCPGVDFSYLSESAISEFSSPIVFPLGVSLISSAYQVAT